MRVHNLTGSMIELPTGHKIRPHQLKAMPTEVICDPDNKVLVEQLRKHGRLEVELGAQEHDQFKQRVTNQEPPKKPRRREGRKIKTVEELPENPTREDLCFATKDALILFARRFSIDEKKLLSMNDADVLLTVAAEYFQDPELRRMI